MSEREFELYLSVLGGMMKLSSAQRKDLAEELRSHMDERLDELIAEGLTRDEAIQTALEEFGDAAGLADNFTQIAQLKQRRRIMRWTTGTIAATTCAILALASFWPQNNPAAPLIVSTIEAQSGGGDIDPGASGGGSIDLSVPQNPIEAKLSRPFPEKVEFLDMPLRDALDFISTIIKVDILIDGNVSEQLDQGQTVNLVLQYGNVTTKTLIALLFEQAGIDEDFSYIVRDEILYITEKNQTMTVRVYNCRDLVSGGGDPAMGIGVPGGYAPLGFDEGGGAGEADIAAYRVSRDEWIRRGGGAGEADIAAYEVGGQFGVGGGGMSSGGFGGGPGGMGMPGAIMGGAGSGSYPREKDPLVSVVTQTVAPHSWNEVGGDGSARLFNGLLVVKNTAEVHQQIEELLKMIREAQKVDPWNRKSISR